jgi:hypothetical protein
MKKNRLGGAQFPFLVGPPDLALGAPFAAWDSLALRLTKSRIASAQKPHRF